MDKDLVSKIGYDRHPGPSSTTTTSSTTVRSISTIGLKREKSMPTTTKTTTTRTVSDIVDVNLSPAITTCASSSVSAASFRSSESSASSLASSTSFLPSWGFSLPQLPELPKFPGNPLPGITQNLQGIRGYFPSNLNLPNFTSAMTSIPMSSVISSFPSMPSMPSLPSMVSSAISGVSFQQNQPRKSWSQLKDSVRRAHRKLFEISGRVPFAFNFAQLKNGSTNVIGTRIYFLCSLPNGSEITLHYCDILENQETSVEEGKNNDTVKINTSSDLASSSLVSHDAVGMEVTPSVLSTPITVKPNINYDKESLAPSVCLQSPRSTTTTGSNQSNKADTVNSAFNNRTSYPISSVNENDSNQEEVIEDRRNTPLREKTSNHINNFEWKLLIDLNTKVDRSSLDSNLENAAHSNQEKLQLERKRMMFSGITSYSYEPVSKRFVFTSSGHLFYFDDDGDPPFLPIRVNSSTKSAKINPVICPDNPDLVALYSDNDVWVIHIKTGQELRLTNTKYNESRRVLSAGFPCYVIQEEFRRYTGFWWRPGSSKVIKTSPGESSRLEFHILYEEVDETEVEIVQLPASDGFVEDYHFPRAGGPNASSDLKLACFKFDESTHQLTDPSCGPLPGLSSLFTIYPHYEYLVRCDWHSRDSIWVQLLNRQQKHLVLGLFSLSKSFPPQILIREDNSPYWVNVHEFLHFLPSPSFNPPSKHNLETNLKPGSEIEFFWISERTGYRHINLVKVQLVASEEDMRSKVARKEYLKRSGSSPNKMEVDAKSESYFGTNTNLSDTEHDLIGSDLQSILLERKQLTSGDWEVSNKEIWIDERNELIYFIGLKETPLERHLYCMSYRDDKKRMKRLSELGYSHTQVAFNADYNLYVNIQSNISLPPFGYVHKKISQPNNLQTSSATSPSSLFFSMAPQASSSSFNSESVHGYDKSNDVVYFKKLGLLLSNSSASSGGNINMDSSDSSGIPSSGSSIMVDSESADTIPGMTKPDLFSYRIKSSGDVVYGLIFKPEFMESDVKYPCVLDVYGGPEVQVVTNSFKQTRVVRRHLLAGEGYVVVAVDCRGSHNRGIKFEAHIQNRIGQVEIADQVEVLEWLAETTGYIDMSRVAIHGWSYGGYLSLMGLAQRPDIFKIAISGAPVTNWSLYDTGYTERYLETPHSNQAAYTKGNVLNYVKNFPDEENRLLLVHGLMDENVHFIHSMQLVSALIKAGKPYQIQVFPSERHSLRKAQSSEHNETQLLSFLEQHLKPASTKIVDP